MNWKAPLKVRFISNLDDPESPWAEWVPVKAVSPHKFGENNEETRYKVYFEDDYFYAWEDGSIINGFHQIGEVQNE